MSMTPKRTEPPEEQSLYDLLIEQELERINLEDGEEEDWSEDGGQEEEEEGLLEGEFLPDAMESYLKRIQEQSEMFEKELKECDDLIQYQGPDYEKGSVAMVPVTEIELLNQAAAEQGLDPETYRKQILSQLDQEDDILSLDEEEDLTADSFHSNTVDKGKGEPCVLLTEVTVDSGISEVGVSDDVPSGGEGTVTQDSGNLPEGDETGAIVLADPSSQFREFLRVQWYHTSEKQRRRDALMKEKSDLEHRDTEKHEEDVRNKRQQKLEELSAEEKQLTQRNATKMAELEKELDQKQKAVSKELKQYQVSIKELERTTEQERIELQHQREQERERQVRQAEGAAIMIQAAYKGYRVRKVYGDEVKQRLQALKEEIELKKIKEKEVELKKLEEAKKEDENRKKKEIEKQEREEQERKAKEEQERKAKEEQLRKAKEEQLRKAEEQERKAKEEQLRKEKEEQGRKMKEKQLQEEREQQERKVKEEQERKEKEEQEIKLREEQERKAKEERLKEEKEEQERKVKEEQERKEKQEQERREQEEQERKAKDEERKKKEEQERKAKEEQERKAKEEQERKAKEEQEKEQKEEKLRVKKEQLIKENENQACAPDVDHGADPCGLLLGSLAEGIEERRRKWMKECVSWSKISNEPWKAKQKSSKKLVKRPSSSKKLPTLEEDMILKEAKVNSLQQVTTVQLADLPGCSMTTLGRCVNLQYLELTSCGVRVVDGLNNCKQLQYVNLQNNQIQYIDLFELDKLEYVNLSSNQLSAVHGLDGCSNLRYLDLSENKIIKLGSLSGLRHLHTLKLCHNQLISTQGLGDVPTLQSLHLSHNHLQSVVDIDKLCLLQTLVLTGNNILQIPVLSNHVLLQDIKLDDNSITSLDHITLSWLPCLRHLTAAQNSITELGQFSSCLVLRSLDLSNNQLLDGNEILKSLSGCRHLESLCVEGNPGGEETTFLSKAASQLPRLSSVDGQTVQRSHPLVPVTPQCSFEATCLTQTQAVQQIWTTYHQNVKLATDLASLCLVHSTMCQKSFDVAVENRYAHEYGEVIVNWPAAPTEPKPTGRTSSRGRSRISEMSKNQRAGNTDTCQVDQTLGRDTDESVTSGKISDRLRDVKPVNEDHVTPRPRDEPMKVMEDRHLSATVKALEPNADRCNVEVMTDSGGVENGAMSSGAAVVTSVSSAWETDGSYRSNSELLSENSLFVQRSDMTLTESENRERQWTYLDQAATKIQAAWRGYSLRNRLLMALEYARFEDEEDEEFAEVDLGDFNFDMADLDDDWKPPPTPKIPTSHALLRKPPSGRPIAVQDANAVSELAPPHPPVFPKQAWRNLTSPLTNRSSPQGRAPRPPSSHASGTDTHRTGLSKKEEMLSEEWGFKDSRTAELMLQRAKKMKYNSDKKRKLSKLDPKQKLALLKKLTESTRMLIPVTQPTRKVLPRKEYFQARAHEVEQKEREKRSEVTTRASRTYEWLHSQVGEFPTSDPAKVLIRSGSDTALPRLDEPGRRVQLVASPAPMDLESVSSMGENRHRSLSMDDSSPLGVQQVPLQFPPIKTNSALSTRVKEKMSWRTAQKNTDVGWGGGRKRIVRS